MEEQSRRLFGTMPDGTQVEEITLRSGGLTAGILTYGGAVRTLTVPGRSGAPVDVALGFDSLEDYRRQDKYLGALVGRVANRIGGARFSLGGREYPLAANNGENHLHGGLVGFDRQVWRVEEAEEDRRKLASQESDQEERVTILNRDRESLSQQLEQVKAVLEASREREEAQSRELEELRRERDSLRRRVAELEPGAAAYTAVKERAAGVELEAHCRAQNVLNEADGQARELRRGMEQWLGRVQLEYDALRSEVESTVSHAADQLEKAGKCLEQVNALLADQDVALEELSRAYDSTDREKVPAPMPLTEL